MSEELHSTWQGNRLYKGLLGHWQRFTFSARCQLLLFSLLFCASLRALTSEITTILGTSVIFVLVLVCQNVIWILTVDYVFTLVLIIAIFFFLCSGGLRLKRDVSEYAEFVRSFKAPAVDEKFELLGT